MIFGYDVLQEHAVVSETTKLIEELELLQEGWVQDTLKRLKEDNKKFEEIVKEVKDANSETVRQAKLLKLTGVGLAMVGAVVTSTIPIIPAMIIGIVSSVAGGLAITLSNYIQTDMNEEISEKYRAYKKEIGELRKKNKNEKLDKELEKVEKAIKVD